MCARLSNVHINAAGVGETFEQALEATFDSVMSEAPQLDSVMSEAPQLTSGFTFGPSPEVGTLQVLPPAGKRYHQEMQDSAEEDSDEGVSAFAPASASVVGGAFTPAPEPAVATCPRNVTQDGGNVLSDEELTSQHAIADSLDASGGGGGPGTAGGASCVHAPATEGGGSGPAGVAINAIATAVAAVGAGLSTPPTPVLFVFPDLQTVVAKVIDSVDRGEDCRSTFENCTTTGEGRVPMRWPQPRNDYLSKTIIADKHRDKRSKFSAQNLGNLSSLV